MKTFRLILMITVAGVLSCCSKKEEKVQTNAIGVLCYEGEDYSLNTTTIRIRNCDLWVNDFVIKCVLDSEKNGKLREVDPKNLTSNYPYYPFTMERLIGLYYARTGCNFQEICPKTAEYAKTHLNTYKHVALINGNCLLFNRISNKNY